MKRVLTLFVLVMVLMFGIGAYNASAYLNSTPTGPGSDDPDDGDGGGHPWGGESSSPGDVPIIKESILTSQVVTGIPVVDVIFNYVFSPRTTTGVQQPAAISESAIRAKWEEAACQRIRKYDTMRRER
jgi:hypothetical protein